MKLQKTTNYQKTRVTTCQWVLCLYRPALFAATSNQPPMFLWLLRGEIVFNCPSVERRHLSMARFSQIGR